MVTSFLHYNDVTDRHAASVRTTCGCSFFIFPTGWYRYVRLSHMGKINGNRDLVCENISIHHECEGGIEKSVPRITNWHYEACPVMTIVDHVV